MRKSILLYFIAFTLLLISFLFFGNAYKELIQQAELTDRAATVYSGFQNLSKQINNAAITNPDLTKANGDLNIKGERLFFADSQSVISQLEFLKSTVRDSVNIQITKKLDTAIKSQLLWILKSNVPDSIINRRSPAHIEALERIDVLINDGIRRTDVVLKDRREKLDVAYGKVKLWMTLFILLSVVLLIYTTVSLFRQQSRRKIKEEALEKTEKQFRHALDNMIEGVQIHDFNWRYVYVNDALIKYSQYKREELIGFTVMEKYPGIEQTDLFKIMQQCMDERVSKHIETEFVFPDGSKTDFELSIQPTPEGIFILSVDKSEQIKAKEKLLKASRLYAFISAINQSIVHISDEQELLNNACRIATETGQFKMAWIGLLDENGLLNMVVLDGDKNATEEVQKYSGIDYSSPERRNTPTGKALSTGLHAVSNDVQNDPAMAAWKEEFVKHGIKANMSLPLKKAGKVIGVFGFTSTIENFFDKEEIALLEESAGDISFALDNFEKAKKHKATETLVVQNEKRFRALIEKSADMKTLATEDGKLIYASPSIEKVLGYAIDEFLQLSAKDLIHPDDLQVLAEKRKELVETPGNSFYHQFRIKHKTGKWNWCEMTLTNMLHEPAVQAVVSNFRDISEKKNAEQQKEFSENNLKSLINNTNDLMWSVDRNFKLITSNQPFDEMTTLMFGKAIEKGSDVLLVSTSHEQLDRYKLFYERAFGGEAFTEIEHSEIPHDFWSEISFYPIRIHGEVIGTACYSRDITKGKIAEGNLKQSESRLREAQALAHISNWEIDLIKNVHTWSEEFYTIYGINKDEVQPSTEIFLSFIHPDDKDFAQKKVQHAFEVVEDSSFNFRFIRKDGVLRYANTEWKFEFDKNNRPVRLYGILQDVTERKLAEVEREKMVAEIIQRSKNLEQFAYVISHNLRAPVANIIGISNILKGDVSETDRKQTQTFLFGAVEQLDHIIKDLVKILQSRDEITESKEPIYFEKLVAEIKLSIQGLIQKEHVQIRTDFSGIDKITSLKGYLHSIFYNLISNSIKYRQAGIEPVITIKSERVNDKIRISFKDNGTGIDLKKHGEKIFGLYKRFHLDVEGKGLGLFMVKSQLEVLGGTISVKSEPGAGAEFIIEIPE